MANEPAAAEAHAAAVFTLQKFPTSEDPEVWFLLQENAFTIYKVPNTAEGQKKKFHMLYTALSADHIAVIGSATIQASLNADEPYNHLKARLQAVFGRPKLPSYFQLFAMPPQGPMKPSALFNLMRNMLPNGANCYDEWFVALFMYRLDPAIKEYVATRTYNSPVELIEAADLVHDIRGTSATVATVTPEPAVAAAAYQQRGDRSPQRDRRGSPGRDQQRGRSQQRNGRSNQKSGRRQPSGRRDNQSWQPNQENSICANHRQYGNNCTHCKPPCAWKGNGQASI